MENPALASITSGIALGSPRTGHLDTRPLRAWIPQTGLGGAMPSSTWTLAGASSPRARTSFGDSKKPRISTTLSTFSRSSVGATAPSAWEGTPT